MEKLSTIFENLKKPFSADQLEWRIGRKSKDKTKATVLCYISARAVANRLDDACGSGNWEIEYSPFDLGEIQVDTYNGSTKKAVKGFMARLSIKGLNDEGEVVTVTRCDGSDVTDFEPVKGGISGAFKRAASMFGIGRYLYDLKEQWVAIDQYGKFTPPNLPAWALPEGTSVPKSNPMNNTMNNNEGFNAPSQDDGFDDEPFGDDVVRFKAGKYAGVPVKEVTDLNYLNWVVSASKMSDDIKNAAREVLGV